ncbi:MAG: hypothetical protein HY392_04955 [Candidatus Diapherotrites archaeon]|nr:hypothetical protein [Candidatus Diapherotrites archaeon]
MKEMTRQAIHLVGGLAITGYFLYAGRESTLIVLLSLLLGTIGLSLAAARKMKIWPLHIFLEAGERRKEKKAPFHAPMVFLLGTIFCLVFFQDNRAITGGLVILSAGDSVSTLAGKKFGKTMLTNRHTLEGTLSGIVFSSMALLLFFPLPQAALASTAGMLSELLGVEDNVAIPLAGAAALTLLL